VRTPRHSGKRFLRGISRRGLLRASIAGGAAGLAGALATKGLANPTSDKESSAGVLGASANPYELAIHHDSNSTVGEYDTSAFDPMRYLRSFEYGSVTRRDDGSMLREYRIFAADRDIEIAPGVKFPAWTYNGTVPGPTLRARQGDRIQVTFENASPHPHTIHFHGFHPAEMDGVFEVVETGESFVYEFDADPFGVHLYHCHVMPLKRHIHKGLYGVFIVDPPEPRKPADELVMVMNGFDTDGNGENEFYAVNTEAFFYFHHPIRIRVGELVRIYLVNLTEFDLVNSFHTHATFFDVYDTGTRLEPDRFTDTIVLGQAERAILELSYRWPGRYLFHAHISEFAELGWVGAFEVVEG
jgi:FtsP/CotA-like multicopper oxidase with cupredoxin domain